MSGRLFLPNEKGAAAAELALLLPLMVVILFGMFEGGYFLFNEHKVLKGVRDGARYAARQSFEYYDCSNSALQNPTTAGLPSAADMTTDIRNVAIFGHPDPTTSTINVTDNAAVVGWDTSEVSVTVSCDGTTTTGLYSSSATPDGAPIVTVSASVPYLPLFGVIGFDASSLSLKASAQAAVMGL